jgi:hypothetical protein
MKTRVWILVIVIGLLLVEHPVAAQRPSCTLRELVHSTMHGVNSVQFADNAVVYLDRTLYGYYNPVLMTVLLDGPDFQPRRLDTSPQGILDFPQIDPTGQMVAYWQLDSDGISQNVYLVQSDGSNSPAELPSPGEVTFSRGLQFSPDSTHLASVYNTSEGRYGIVIWNLPEWTVSTVNLPSVEGRLWIARVTNTHMFFRGSPTPGGDSYAVYSVPLDGSREPIRLDDGQGWIAFDLVGVIADSVIYAESYTGPIYSVDADKRTPPHLYENVPSVAESLYVEDFGPYFTVDPSGRYLLYIGVENNIRELYRLDLQTGDLLILNPPIPETQPEPVIGVLDFGLDDSYIGFHATGADSNFHYYFAPIDGSAAPIEFLHPAWIRALSPSIDHILMETPLEGEGLKMLTYSTFLLASEPYVVDSIPDDWSFMDAHIYPDERFVYSVWDLSEGGTYRGLYLGQCE